MIQSPRRVVASVPNININIAEEEGSVTDLTLNLTCIRQGPGAGRRGAGRRGACVTHASRCGGREGGRCAALLVLTAQCPHLLTRTTL